MGIHVNIGELKDRLSELVAAAERGEEIVIARAGRPAARMGPFDAEAPKAVRKAQLDAWMGSFSGVMSPEIGDLFLKPTFTDEEMEQFGRIPNDR